MDLESSIFYIRRTSLPITNFRDETFNYKDDFFDLSSRIQDGKLDLTSNSVRFMLAKILNSELTPRNLNYTGYFELIVIGDFESEVNLVEEVANSLTTFYLNTEILPRIRPINENYLRENIEKYNDIINKTVLIYDREESIF
jgi:hypothetical protein